MEQPIDFARTNYRLWFSVGLVVTGGLVLVAMVLNGVPFSIAWKDVLLSTAIIVTIAQLLYSIQHNYHPSHPINFITLGIVVVFTAFSQLTFNGLFSAWVGKELWLTYIHAWLPIRGFIVFLVILIVSLYWWTRKNEQMHEKIRQQLIDQERALTKAELDNLHQQLQPHFLFNSLNSIGALTILQPEEAHRMLLQLSDFLRGTLRKDVQQLVPLKEELDQVERYLNIEKVRFGHRLQTEIRYHGHCDELQVPALILQPIIENAIKYGLYGRTEAILITIDITCEPGTLIIRVVNPYDAEAIAASSGKGFGLASIRRRLSLFFRQSDLLATSRDDHNFTTTLIIPQL
jgi:sensor histidine kinase YesM